MGNSQSFENPDVYTYHESVLKQGAEAAGSNSSDESEDEMQEGFSREASTSSFVQNEDDSEKNETNLNSSEDENSEEKVIIVGTEGDVISDENSEDSSLHQEAQESNEIENEAVAMSTSIALKHTSEHENSEFVTPPSSPSATEPSPGPARRSSRLQLKTSTLNTTSKKRPRLSMRDSDDDDDDDETQYSTPPVTRKTPAPHQVNNISVQSQKSNSKNFTESNQLTTPKNASKNNTSELPCSSGETQSETGSEMIGTSASPSNDNGRPNLRSTGGEARPFLRAKRNVQLFGKNAVHLQKVVSIPPTSEASVEVSNSTNNESNSCTRPTSNNLDSQSEQPASPASEDISAECTTSYTSYTTETEIESTTVASTQENHISEALPDPARIHEVASNFKDNAVFNSSTQRNQMSEALQNQTRVTEVASSSKGNVVLNSSTIVTCTASKPTSSEAEVDDIIMRDVDTEKASNTPRSNMNSDEISASGSNSVQPMAIPFVDNSKIKSSMSNPMEVTTAAEEESSQNKLPVFGSMNNISCTSAVDIQPSQAGVISRPLSFSQLVNAQVAASSISNIGSTSMALVLPSQHQTHRSSASTFGQASQSSTPTPSVSSSATSMSYPHNHPQTSRSGPNFIFGQASGIHTPISPPMINPTPHIASPFPQSPSSTLLSVQKCCIFPISSNFDMTVRQGDITKQDAAAIVNSTDIHLRHQGVLSRLIAEAASPQMMFDCQQHLQNHGGSLNILHVLDTTAGGRLNTNVERIIHVVPPSGSSTYFDHLSVNKLVSAYLQCMLHADRILNSTSLAFPLLGAGSFPTDICINSFYNAVLIFLSDKRSLSRLNNIRLIINEPQIFHFAVDYFTSCYENILTQGIDSAVAEALDSFYGNRNSSLSSFCVKDEVDGTASQSTSKKWSASFRNLFRGPAVKRPRL